MKQKKYKQTKFDWRKPLSVKKVNSPKAKVEKKNKAIPVKRKCTRSRCIEGNTRRDGRLVTFDKGKGNCDQCLETKGTKEQNAKALALDVEYKEIVGKLSDLNAKIVLTSEDMANIKELEKRRDYCYEHGRHTKKLKESKLGNKCFSCSATEGLVTRDNGEIHYCPEHLAKSIANDAKALALDEEYKSHEYELAILNCHIPSSVDKKRIEWLKKQMEVCLEGGRHTKNRIQRIEEQQRRQAEAGIDGLDPLMTWPECVALASNFNMRDMTDGAFYIGGTEKKDFMDEGFCWASGRGNGKPLITWKKAMFDRKWKDVSAI